MTVQRCLGVEEILSPVIAIHGESKRRSNELYIAIFYVHWPMHAGAVIILLLQWIFYSRSDILYVYFRTAECYRLKYWAINDL